MAPVDEDLCRCHIGIVELCPVHKPEATVPCEAKHTPYQPDNDHWRCPKCGDKTGEFVVDCSPDEANEQCPLLHVDDECVCTACSYGARGSVVAKALAKRDHVVTCPTCKGAGVVPDEQPQ